MKRNLILMLSLMSVLIVSGAAIPQQSVADLFQQAVHQEEIKGDLQAAIPLYQRVERESSDRLLAARAQLRIGLCYEKLGKDEARKAYERLVRNYADQPEQVKLARARLAALGKTSDADKEPAFTTRKVWTDAQVSPIMAASPDGRYLSFMDWSTGDLAIRDLETGTNHRLTNKGPWEKSSEYAMRSRWSPDGKQIAYEWGIESKGFVEIRVVTREGGKPRTLIDCEDNEWMHVHDWSLDGKQILIFLWKAESQIVLVSAVDGTPKVLKTFQGVWWDYNPTMYFSHDGRYIAYDLLQDENSDEHDIFLISADGSNEVSLVKHPANDFLLGWMPDREGILFGSDRTGSFDLWFLPVSEGKAQGRPELVKRGIGQIESIGFSQSGSYYYIQDIARSEQWNNVYVVRMDPQSGKILALPEKSVRRFEGYNFQPKYSPDGKYLAYITTMNRTPYPFSPKRPNNLRIRSLETGKEQEFSTEFRIRGRYQWSSDGQFIYFTDSNDQGKGEFYQVNTQNGEVAPIDANRQEIPAGARIVKWEFSPDENSIIYERQDKPNEPFRILIRDRWTAEEKQLYTTDYPTMFSTSPDGKWLALKFNTGEDKQKVVQVMPISGGQPKELLRYDWGGTNYVGHIEWTADGKYILFQKLHYTKDQRDYTLWRIAAEGGEPEELDLVMASFGHLSTHPDGQHLAFNSIGFTRKFPSVWVMENFLPPADGGGK